MSHVDEGLLNAYVDGAFAPDDADGLEIEAHLASCADCRARVEETRELQERARDVLRHATPADVHVPPFEALRARRPEVRSNAPARGTADHSVGRRLARSHVRLAWAASVVLAVGAGWIGNELVRRDSTDFGTVRDAAVPVSQRERGGSDGMEATALEDAAETHDRRTAASEETAPANLRERPRDADVRRPTAQPSGDRQAASGSVDEPRAEAERQTTPPREGGAGDAVVAAPGMAQADSPSRPAAAPAQPTVSSGETAPLTRTAEKLFDRDTARQALPAVADRLRRQAADQAQVELEAITIPAPTRADTASAVVTRTTYSANDVVELDRMPPALADGRALTGHLALLSDYAAAVRSGLWSAATPMQAAAALGREPAGITGLQHLTTESAVVNGGVLVRQRYALEDGTPIELIQRPGVQAPPRADMAAFREGSAELPAAGVVFNKLDESSPPFHGESVVAVSRPGLVLLVKGAVPQDSMRDIAARIR